MGLGSSITGAAVDAAAKQAEMKRALKGRTPDQQKVIKYFQVHKFRKVLEFLKFQYFLFYLKIRNFIKINLLFEA